jgi:NAD(P)-dependent dehydrogenase (short-subunit alcohol dehydrogenase family)
MSRFLADKTALVTGSSRNLGAAIARALSSRGARVVVGYQRSDDLARSLVDELRAATGAEHVAIAGELSTGTGAVAFTKGVLDQVGQVDVLVNNAGPFSMEPFAELPPSEWERIWNANVKAAFIAARAFAPGMRQAGWGRIVNVSAGSAYIRNHSIYTLAKAALITFTEELAVELAPEVTVNAVAPGQIAESAEDIAEFDPSFVERAIAATPAGRLARRDEVAELVAEMCGPAFASVTGVTLPVDGGWRIPRF